MILLNAILSSVQKISKIIKQSAKLVINLRPGQKPLLDEATEATSDQKYLSLDHKEGETSDSSELETNPGKKLTDTIAKSNQIGIVNRTRSKQTEKLKFKIKKLLSEPKTVQVKKDGQVIKTITANRKAYYLVGTKTKQY